MTNSIQPKSQERQLQAEIAQLRQEVEQLQRANRDLEIALCTTAEHGDLVEAQLHETNQQLQAEIVERKRAESALKNLLHLISKQKNDLEIILETITQHGDILDIQWCQKVHQANQLAVIDGLTQIANRRRFDEYFEQQWQQMMRERSPLSILLCDIDYFKQFNDTYGHIAGDHCLKEIAQVIKRSLKRPTDLAVRYGGEEFAAILPQTSLDAAMTIAQELQLSIKQLQIPHARSTVSEYVTLSIGIASTIPDAGQQSKNLLDHADQLLYLAKQQGRNQIIYPSLSKV